MSIARFMLVLATALFVPLSALAEQYVDVVYLKDGSRIVGVMIENRPNATVKIRTGDGSEFVYNYAQIDRITREPAPVDPVRADITQRHYPEVGLAIGTPGGLNLNAGQWMGPIGIRLAAGYMTGESSRDRIRGLQLSVLRKATDTRRSRHVYGMCLGVSRMRNEDLWGYVENKSFDYIGAVYNYNWRGLFIETGLGIGVFGHDGFPLVQLMFQIGYMHRFLPKA